MFYVVKVYKTTLPLIVESFEDKDLAYDYAKILNKANKGEYRVLTFAD